MTRLMNRSDLDFLKIGIRVRVCVCDYTYRVQEINTFYIKKASMESRKNVGSLARIVDDS